MKTLLLFLSLLLFPLAHPEASAAAKVYDLRCENLREPLAVDTKTPRFSWKTESEQQGFRQTAYQLVVFETREGKPGKTIWDSGKVASGESVLVPYAGPELRFSRLYGWKVRIWDVQDEAQSWSDPGSFGIGLLEWDQWKGSYIGLPDTNDEMSSPILLRDFVIEDMKGDFLLHVNSLGYHEVYVNGRRVGEDVLSPAVSQLDKRSLSVTYDITPCLTQGRNTLALWLGQGWYKGNLYPGVVHNGPLVRAQLERSGNRESELVLVTDDAWKGVPSGYYNIGNWMPHQFGGEKVDGRTALAIPGSELMSHSGLTRAMVYPVGRHIVSPQMCEPNRIREVITPASVSRDKDGNRIVDMGTAFTGWARIALPRQAAGSEIVLEYADHYDGGVFSTHLGQRDVYISSGSAGDQFCNKFNYHSFRYIRIRGLEGDVDPGEITGYAIYPEFDDTGSFECSDRDMNDIYNLVKRTFTCLTLGGYTVDCQHIERLGYGGDGHASANSLQSAFGVYGLYRNWMQAWKDCIRPDGGLPHTAPRPVSAGGGPYWCAFMVAGPWSMYEQYGDKAVLEEYYPYMKSWIYYVDKYFRDGLFTRWPDTDYRNWFLGDWATPREIDPSDSTSVSLVSNCVISECYATLQKIAHVLSETGDAELFGKCVTEINRAIHARFFNPSDTTYGTRTQIDMVYPLLCGAVPEALREAVKAKLKTDIAQVWNGHLVTGLVGVTKVTEWMTQNSEADLMYSMLKKREYPGYLYMLDNGATATWEYWHGERSYIHNCYNGIGSWFSRAPGGIRPDPESPGYRRVVIQPQVPAGMTWAKTAQETPYGRVSLDWKLEGGTMEMALQIPVGCEASVVIPPDIRAVNLDGAERPVSGGRIDLSSGTYMLTYPD